MLAILIRSKLQNKFTCSLLFDDGSGRFPTSSGFRGIHDKDSCDKLRYGSTNPAICQRKSTRVKWLMFNHFTNTVKNGSKSIQTYLISRQHLPKRYKLLLTLKIFYQFCDNCKIPSYTYYFKETE